MFGDTIDCWYQFYSRYRGFGKIRLSPFLWTGNVATVPKLTQFVYFFDLTWIFWWDPTCKSYIMRACLLAFHSYIQYIANYLLHNIAYSINCVLKLLGVTKYSLEYFLNIVFCWPNDKWYENWNKRINKSKVLTKIECNKQPANPYCGIFFIIMIYFYRRSFIVCKRQ